MFKADQVTYDALLEALGGREMLELMINARDFDCVHRPTGSSRQGLRFTFKVCEEDLLRLAVFDPMGYSTTSSSFYAPTYDYMVRMTVETLNGLSFELAKPYHCVDLTHPENMVKVFEIAANLTVTFH